MDTMTERQNYDELAREHGTRKRRRVLFRLEKQDYVYAMSKDMDLPASTIRSHIRDLQGDGLVEVVEERNGRRYYQLTADGREVIRRMNKPEV